MYQSIDHEDMKMFRDIDLVLTQNPEGLKQALDELKLVSKLATDPNETQLKGPLQILAEAHNDKESRLSFLENELHKTKDQFRQMLQILKNRDDIYYDKFSEMQQHMTRLKDLANNNGAY